MYRKTVSLLDVKENDKVLDVGYGNGYLLKKLYHKQKLDLYGIDISKDMLIQATKRNKKAAANNNLHLSVGDCCKLKFSNETFNVVTSINTIYFWKDPVKGLSEIRRTLKSGGSFINMVYVKEWLDKLSYTKKGFKKYTVDELVEYGKQAGFTNIDVIQIMKGKSYAVIYKK